MPKFYWKGINLSGVQCKGVFVAQNYDDLKSQLLQQGIALLSCKSADKTQFNWQIYSKKLSKYDFIDFFWQLSILLDGGVDLLSAINTIEKQEGSGNKRDILLRDVLTELRQALQTGNSFASALSKYNKIFDDFIIQMVQVGQHSGNLSFVLAQIALHLKKNQQLKKDLFNAALVPMFTVFFAMMIVVVILLVVVPQFQIFFNSLGKQLPTATRRIIRISNFLRSWQGLCMLIGICGSVFILLFFLGQDKIKKFKDWLLLKIPYIKNVVELANFTHFVQALTVLLKSGITLKESVVCARDSMNNVYLKAQINKVLDDINRGQSLSDAIAALPEFYKKENLVALIRVGEQTGSMVNVLEKATEVFQEEMKAYILVVTSLFQPVLLIIVGLIIGLLVWMIYMPIFNLAYSLN